MVMRKNSLLMKGTQYVSLGTEYTLPKSSVSTILHTTCDVVKIQWTHELTATWWLPLETHQLIHSGMLVYLEYSMPRFCTPVLMHTTVLFSTWNFSGFAGLASNQATDVDLALVDSPRLDFTPTQKKMIVRLGSLTLHSYCVPATWFLPLQIRGQPTFYKHLYQLLHDYLKKLMIGWTITL